MGKCRRPKKTSVFKDNKKGWNKQINNYKGVSHEQCRTPGQDKAMDRAEQLLKQLERDEMKRVDRELRLMCERLAQDPTVHAMLKYQP